VKVHGGTCTGILLNFQQVAESSRSILLNFLLEVAESSHERYLPQLSGSYVVDESSRSILLNFQQVAESSRV
jgi:hypothetical protein